MDQQKQSNPMSQPPVTSSNFEAASSTSNMKRKSMKPRSAVWDHFSKFLDDTGIQKGKCNYCEKEFYCDPKRNGTSALKHHMSACIKNPHSVTTRQSQLSLQPLSFSTQEGGGNYQLGMLSSWHFDQDVARRKLAKMTIIDELPFMFVEGEGFKEWVECIQPKFRIPSRWTVSRDCYDLYLEERKKLKSYFQNSSQRICITTDTWTSLQRINYMCITAHYIDDNWTLHKKILNFCPIGSHKGDDIGMDVESCLLNWGIKRVFTVTVDNASSNDVAVTYLKKKINGWGFGILNCKYLHMRCIAHIINLVVVDGLKENIEAVKRVREAVRYVRQSPARLQKFKSCCEMEGIQSKCHLSLDVSTRWNSTYLMLRTAEKFENAFDRFATIDPCFKFDLVSGKECDGVPDSLDWDYIRKIVDFLGHFYDLTLKISGSRYVTSNIFFDEISSIDCLLQEWKMSDDLTLANMGQNMKVKFDKYWGDPDKMNKLIYIAVVMDPRYKMEFMGFALSAVYGNGKGLDLTHKIKSVVYELFDEYKRMFANENANINDGHVHSNAIENLDDEGSKKRSRMNLGSQFLKHKIEIGEAKNKSDLDCYLNESIQVVDENDEFDILLWWKLNSNRFPILSHMARDILSVPISTVASESAFSTGGRILDPFRSSLTPKVVEALICTQDWLRKSHCRKSIEEQIADMERLEEGM
ncbi:hypothetical protein MANES_03G090444v8 [Manihot esculenta]|nr:hypothetical protein MANES_03G090444v8 [Manihot esculenta]